MQRRVTLSGPFPWARHPSYVVFLLVSSRSKKAEILQKDYGFAEEDKTALLTKASIFNGLPQATLQRIAAMAEIEERSASEILVKQGEVPTYLYVILRGQIGYSAEGPEGKFSIVDIANPPEAFPLASCLGNSPVLSGFHVLAAARLLRIPAAELRHMVQTDPEIGTAMVRSLSQLTRNLYASVTDMKIRSAAQRLGSYIITLAREQGYPKLVRLPMSKQFLASRLGTTPENLSRCFAGLRAHGIETSGSSIHIKDADRLAAFITPSYDDRR
jgi:CRP/FNR family transcriptional activator FtrB